MQNAFRSTVKSVSMVSVMGYKRKSERITERQRAIIIGVSNGLTMADIAGRMQLAQRTLYRDLNSARKILSIEGTRFTVGELVVRARNANLDVKGYTLNSSGRIVAKVSRAVRGA